MERPRRLPISTQSFKQLRTDGDVYVDKDREPWEKPPVLYIEFNAAREATPQDF